MLLALLASARRSPAALPTERSRGAVSGGERVRGLRAGSVELEVVLAVIADLQVEVDATGTHRVTFVLEGHLPATQLSDDGVTIVPLEALRISDLAVSRDVVERLGAWEDAETAVTGRLHFERAIVDRYRGRGPLRVLSLADERGEEIVLRRS
jgi:hypothetical protein